MKDLIVLDCEVYPNYFLIAFKKLDTKKVITIEVKGENSQLTKEQSNLLKKVMKGYYTFGFNSLNYDMQVILYALNDKTAKEIHTLSDDIIQNGLHPFQVTMKYQIKWQLKDQFHHFDICEPAPGVRVSLKLYGGRMHSKRLQDLPIEPGTILANTQMEDIKTYCINDLDTTIDLYERIKERIALRSNFIDTYGDYMLSKSDAQLAEMVIKSELGLSKNIKVTIPKNTTFKYKLPDYMGFKTPKLKEALQIVLDHDFELDLKGSIKLPKSLSALKIKIGDSVYKLGIGGIHTQEKSQTVVPKEGQLLIDKDVASYYPQIVLNQKLYPKHLGANFLNVYEGIVKKRLAAKKLGDKVTNESLKIVINGCFGKFGNKWSSMYSPDLLMQVTMTGQLSLLMLIEELDLEGIKVVSANTDGFVSLLNKTQYKRYEAICANWERATGFTLESAKYQGLYSRDVNNYLAITDYGHKGKGIFTLNSLEKNPQAEIIIESVIRFLTNGDYIADTIRNCKDVRKFLIVRSVTGGAVWNGQYLGRVVRWVWTKNGKAIHGAKPTAKQKEKGQVIGSKVATSDNARPIMELGEFPNDIYYEKYISEAMDVLEDIGYLTL